MRGRPGSRRAHRLLVAVLVGISIIAGTQVAGAHRTELSVEVTPGSVPLAPDGRSMSVRLTTTCDPKWTIVEARVTVTQPQASGEASFVPRCGRLTYGLQVTVPALDGMFQTGEAQASAVLVVRQGKTKEARDSARIGVHPQVAVRLADRAALVGGGAVLIDVTVTCPPTSIGRGGEVTVYDGEAVGTGAFGPTPCDGNPQTIEVTVEASEGRFQVGAANAFTFAGIEHEGSIFQGSDFRAIQVS